MTQGTRGVRSIAEQRHEGYLGLNELISAADIPYLYSKSLVHYVKTRTVRVNQNPFPTKKTEKSQIFPRLHHIHLPGLLHRPIVFLLLSSNANPSRSKLLTHLPTHFAQQ